MPQPILYHMPQTRGATTAWLNEELGAPCEIRVVNLRAGEQKTGDFLKLNPMGKTPVLVDDETVVTETAAICLYLADKYIDAGLAPPFGDPARGPYYRWILFAPSCIEPAMLDRFDKVERKRTGPIGHGAPETVIAALRSLLSAAPYVLGDRFSAADVVLGSSLNFAVSFGAFEAEPVFADYLQRLAERPARRTAQEKDAGYLKELGLA